MTIFSTVGSTLFIGPPQASDLTLAQYQALDTGSFATGSYTFSAQPTTGSIITIDSTAITFETSGATGNQVNLGGTLAQTLAALLTFLQGSTDTNLVKMTYAIGASNTILQITSVLGGVAGNAYTLVAGTSPATNATVSAATLTTGGGTAWTQVDEVENLGDFGDTSSKINFTSIADARVRKLKGSRDAGMMALVCGFDARDLGQNALRDAQATSFKYAFKLIASDKRLPSDTATIFWFNALVESQKTNFGANNNVVKTTFNIDIDSAIVELPSAAA